MPVARRAQVRQRSGSMLHYRLRPPSGSHFDEHAPRLVARPRRRSAPRHRRQRSDGARRPTPAGTRSGPRPADGVGDFLRRLHGGPVPGGTFEPGARRGRPRRRPLRLCRRFSLAGADALHVPFVVGAAARGWRTALPCRGTRTGWANRPAGQPARRPGMAFLRRQGRQGDDRGRRATRCLPWRMAAAGGDPLRAGARGSARDDLGRRPAGRKLRQYGIALHQPLRRPRSGRRDARPHARPAAASGGRQPGRDAGL